MNVECTTNHCKGRLFDLSVTFDVHIMLNSANLDSERLSKGFGITGTHKTSAECCRQMTAVSTEISVILQLNGVAILQVNRETEE